MSDLAERHYVGAMLHMPPATVLEAADIVFPEWISDPQIAAVFVATIENAKENISEPAAVVPTLLRLGLPSQHHGIATGLVVDLLADCPLPHNWPYYASLVAAGRARARLQACGQVLVERAYIDPLERLTAVLEDARAEIQATQAAVLQLTGQEPAA